jgi:hypothetical protein
MKPNINSVEVHPQVRKNSHPSDEQQRVVELEIMEQLCARLSLSGPEGPRDPDIPEIRAHLPDVRLKGGPEFWGCPPIHPPTRGGLTWCEAQFCNNPPPISTIATCPQCSWVPTLFPFLPTIRFFLRLFFFLFSFLIPCLASKVGSFPPNLFFKKKFVSWIIF